MTIAKPKLLVIALGNPGEKYAKTRHNVGWILFDLLFPEAIWEENSYAHALQAEIDGMILVKPLTFMNESGKVIPWFKQKMDIDDEHIVVVHDEVDTALGTWKFSTMRGNAGHNGIRSIEHHIKPVPRLRIGIGTPGDYNAKPNVLGNFTAKELEVLETLVLPVKKGLEKIRDLGITKAQSVYK